jgi:hypothetical protein
MNIYEHEGKYYTDRIDTPIDSYYEEDPSKYHYMEVELNSSFEWKILMRGSYLSKREPLEVVPEQELG